MENLIGWHTMICISKSSRCVLIQYLLLMPTGAQHHRVPMPDDMLLEPPLWKGISYTLLVKHQLQGVKFLPYKFISNIKDSKLLGQFVHTKNYIPLERSQMSR